MRASKATQAALAVALVSTGLAGLYLVVYLYRWEMHRALVAGVIFIAGEVALAALLILRRIESLVARQAAVGAGSPTGEPPHEPAPATAGEILLPAAPSGNGAGGDVRFPWLDPTRFSVFVPILLGAGVIVSGFAWVIEQLARATARHGEHGRVERRLHALAGAPGGLWMPEGVPSNAMPDPGGGGNGRRRFFRRLALLLLFASMVVTLLTLALLGRTRPEMPLAGARSHIEVEVRTSLRLDVEVGARSLWGACHSWVDGQRLVELRRLDEASFLIVLEPALGEQARRRLHGCLNDGTLERVNGHVLSHTIVPVG
jgi:hypothetical protein